MKDVVLIIGSEYQANACGFIKEFEELGGELDGILCLAPRRNLFFHIKKPFKIFKKIRSKNILNLIAQTFIVLFNKSLLSDVRNSWSVVGENSWDLLSSSFDIIKYAKERNISLNFASGITSSLIKSYTNKKSTIFAMYVGGIIPKSMLDNKKAEFINAHMGEMPFYRGMNVIEWSVLENKQPKVSVMIMNAEVDGGDVIWSKNILLKNENSIAELRKSGYVNCYKAMAEGVLNYQKTGIREVQPKGAKYYYKMHPEIRKKVESSLPFN
jgi:hypothetical protein